VKAARILLPALLVLGAVAALGWFFLGQLGGTPRAEGPPGVLLSAPPDFTIEDLGETGRPAAARSLSDLLARHPGEPKLGVHFRSGAYELYWLVDRAAAQGPLLIERSAGPGGTRLETEWRSGLNERLAWGEAHGDFEAPGLAGGQRKNLYH
jgi:hypothetical protein